ncbi:MAG: nucleotidyltransferase family protein [Bacteroidota bacterium]
MEAIILAGGLGTRLQSVVSEMPKCMAPVAGKPFLAYVLERLVNEGLTHAILSVGYKHEMITSHIGNNYNGIPISYAIEYEPLGTGGGIRMAMAYAKEDNVFVLNGDTVFEVNLPLMDAYHQENDFDLTMALRQLEDTSRYGAVELEANGSVVRFLEKGFFTGPGLINGGIYCIRRKSLLALDLPEKFSFEKDLLEKNILNLGGFPSDAYFIDIGIPEDYERAQKEFISK